MGDVQVPAVNFPGCFMIFSPTKACRFSESTQIVLGSKFMSLREFLGLKNIISTGMSCWYSGSMDYFTPIYVGWIHPVDRL